MTDRREPVKNTCPIIDSVIDDLKEVYKGFSYYVEKMSDTGMYNKEMIEDMENLLHKVDTIAHPNGAMEELRSANDALRTWGNSLVEDLEEIEKVEI